MHTFSDTGAGVPAFLAKLWRLVEDPETNNLICWSKDGRSFIIQNQAQFARELLPLNYKHNNMASFIRQLNMYGFHKITSIDNGGLKFDRDDMEFSHPCFKRNCPYLLEHIKRKIANTKSIDEKATVKPEAVSKVLNDVKAMRGRQDSLDSRFSVMKQENEALWREIASLRQKHAKQQQIVNKLIQFLITIVQPSRNNMTSVKRHMQLMINDTPEQAKLRKASESGSECGPVIHELGEELFDEANAENDSDLDAPMSPYANLPSVGSSHNDNDSPVPKIERPQSNGSINSHLFEYSNQSADDAQAAAAPGNITPGRSGAVINTVNPDGSQIVYHVTEVADSAPQTPESVINDDNHLTTPMVKEMNRNKMSQMKNKANKRKMGAVSSTITTSTSTSSSPATKMLRSSGNGTEQMLIKTEKTDVDPMTFWNALNNDNTTGTPEPLASSSNSTLNLNVTLDPRLLSPMNDQNLQSAAKMSNDAADMYNADNFIASDMPSQLFEDSPIIDDTSLVSGGSYNPKFDFRQNPSSSGGLQQKQLQSLGKFADYNNQALSSTSKNNSKLQLSKVNNSNNILNSNDMREEVSMHLDTVQDDLDTLKDLLRTDSYSLDANTLLGNGTPPAGRIYLPPQLEADIFNKLFNDSDILGSYGLGMVPDNNQQDKKGSELMTYQPIYDLSDIMDINNQDKEDANTNGNNNPKPLSPTSSVLNTPYHE
ncbi:heat shock factor protein isoform X1 [Episyrphus balteatus]|uniref:heat shock factor protein isoform X1 n=1 Tax=Episyrphus balteatus TaxID=286459 RepID=UPI002484F430|nr:heat shock factor protein isoform X1 [Episyrphus balteatus]